MDEKPNRRRSFCFAFSLRTLFVAVTLFGTVGYWGVRKVIELTADAVFRSMRAALDADTVTRRDACEASVHLLNAELKVPLADRATAKAAHLQRVGEIKHKLDWIAEHGVSCEDPRELAKRQAEVDTYYADAQRLASGDR